MNELEQIEMLRGELAKLKSLLSQSNDFNFHLAQENETLRGEILTLQEKLQFERRTAKEKIEDRDKMIDLRNAMIERREVIIKAQELVNKATNDAMDAILKRFNRIPEMNIRPEVSNDQIN